MRYVLTTRMVKMAEKRYPHEDSMRVREIARKRHDHLSASALTQLFCLLILL